MSMVSLVLTAVGPDFKTLVTPLVKHVRLHLISPKDLVEVRIIHDLLPIPCSFVPIGFTTLVKIRCFTFT